MFKSERHPAVSHVINHWLNKKSLYLLTAAAVASPFALAGPAKAEPTCPTYTNAQLTDPKYGSIDYTTMTVKERLMSWTIKTCDTPMLTIAHRGVHSFGMDYLNDYPYSNSVDHSSQVSVAPVGGNTLHLVDENTFMSYLIAAYRVKSGDTINMFNRDYKVYVPWTRESDAPNAIEVDVQKDVNGKWVALHDSKLEREVGPTFANKIASEVSLLNVMRVYHPADFTFGKEDVITWDLTNPVNKELYRVPGSENASWAQILGGSKIFIQYHVRSIDDLKQYHRFLLQRLYDWKKVASPLRRVLIARAVQQFYYYMHIYDVQRLYTNGGFADAQCGTRFYDAKSTKAIECVSVIEKWVREAEADFLAANPGAVAGVDTPKKVGLMSGMFQDTTEDTSIVATMNAHRAIASNRVNFMGLDISNNSGVQYPAYIGRWHKLMRDNGYQISHTMNHPSHYTLVRDTEGRLKMTWGFLRSGAIFYKDPTTWSRHATHAIGGKPHGPSSYKPTMLVSDRPYNDRIGYEGSGWNWEFFVD